MEKWVFEWESMTELFDAKTFSLSIKADPKKIYSFVSKPENLPKWATAFCKSITKSGDDWVMQTDLGPAKVKFVEQNDFGILDHYVYPAPNIEVYVPMRVLSNFSGSEILFTLYRLPFMDEEKFKTDLDLVERDLNTLKEVMEK